MPVNPITGIVTYTLDEWKEESQLWERDGALRERESIIALIEKTHKHGITHSERCAIRHDFADYLVERIKERTMSKRMREVVGEHSTWYVCDVHDWDFTNEDKDVCPVCLGESLERERVIERLIDRGVMRVDALGSTVFVNCNTLEVEYLGDTLSKGEEDAR